MTGTASAPTPAIATHGLAKRYGRQAALNGIDLVVPRGQVFGYLGPNGAGKTTTIRLLAGLLRPSAGTAEVLGLDVVRERGAVHRRIGYLPGDFVGYPDLTGQQYLQFLARLRGGVDWQVLTDSAKRLDLDLDRRIGTLSHGNRQKVGILQAVMHRPELLILDEPTTGLDPIVQREFLALLREIRDEGRTVFLSSHVLSEVEAVADSIGILREGRLVVEESVEGLKAKAMRRIDLTFAGEPPVGPLSSAAGVREVTVDGRTARVVVVGSTADLLQVAAPHQVDQIVSHEPDLEEIFLMYFEPQE
jgi:ABC-2 type transport system ATP-binding protein